MTSISNKDTKGKKKKKKSYRKINMGIAISSNCIEIWKMTSINDKAIGGKKKKKKSSSNIDIGIAIPPMYLLCEYRQYDVNNLLGHTNKKMVSSRMFLY